MITVNDRQDRSDRPIGAIRRWGLFAAFGTLCGAVVLAGAVIAVGLVLSAPSRAKIGVPPADLRAEEVTFPSASGAVLRGWFIEGKPGGGTVVLTHGVRDNRLSMVRRARLLDTAGFSVLLFDFQAHGESTGDRITFGHLEALDVRAAIGFVRRRLPAERVGAVGVSLGGAAALLGPGPLPVDALVLEAVYPDIGRAIANRIRAVLGPVTGTTIGGLVARPLTRSFELLLPWVVGFGPADLRPIDRISEITAPVLVAVGTRDRRTTTAETAAILDRAPGPKFLWLIEGAGHVDLEAFAPDDYRRHVLPFLAEHLHQQ